MFGLEAYVIPSGVRFAVLLSSLACGPSGGYLHHMYTLNGLMFRCVES